MGGGDFCGGQVGCGGLCSEGGVEESQPHTPIFCLELCFCLIIFLKTNFLGNLKILFIKDPENTNFNFILPNVWCLGFFPN